MRPQHVEALRAALAALGCEVHDTEAVTVVKPDGTRVVPHPPYLVLWGDEATLHTPRLEDVRDGTDARFSVTWTAGTPEAARYLGQRVRDALTPGGRGVLQVPGEHVDLLHLGTRGVQVDRDVVLRDLNRHPAYGVDTFRLISHPA